MLRTRPKDACLVAVLTGAAGDTTVTAESSAIRRMVILVAGAAGSYVEAYDGAVASNRPIAFILGNTLGANQEFDGWAQQGLHIKIVDSTNVLSVLVYHEENAR